MMQLEKSCLGTIDKNLMQVVKYLEKFVTTHSILHYNTKLQIQFLAYELYSVGDFIIL